ncbi:hypothetical protein IAT38_000391 [Cryptococcus sp. DSM 104549]
MMFSSYKLAVGAALVSVASAALSINTPASLVECQPVSLSWSGGSGSPYYLAINKGGDSTSAALENLDSADSSPVTWTVNLASGTNVTIKVTDASGNIAYSSPVVIQAGSSSSCLTSSSSSSSTAASDSSSTGSSDSSTTASGSSSGTAATSASTSSAAATSSAASAALLTRENAGVMAAVLGFVASAFAVVA